jgi:hypothetical protein
LRSVIKRVISVLPTPKPLAKAGTKGYIIRMPVLRKKRATVNTPSWIDKEGDFFVLTSGRITINIQQSTDNHLSDPEYSLPKGKRSG